MLPVVTISKIKQGKNNNIRFVITPNLIEIKVIRNQTGRNGNLEAFRKYLQFRDFYRTKHAKRVVQP